MLETYFCNRSGEIQILKRCLKLRSRAPAYSGTLHRVQRHVVKNHVQLPVDPGENQGEELLRLVSFRIWIDQKQNAPGNIH